MFADNIVLTATDNSINGLSSSTNKELEKIDNLIKLNELTINYKKNSIFVFCQKKKILENVLSLLENITLTSEISQVFTCYT